MRISIFLIVCILFTFSFQDGRDPEVAKIREEQLKYLQGEKFAQIGITGHGIRIAVLDGGFPGTNSHPALKHLIDRKQIIATWNFVKDQENVFSGVQHGTEVLACIAGVMDGKPLGLAPDAEFLLALTESRGEPRQEELNWARAVDWAINQGAQIIQSSLGYSYQRYFTYEMDGRTSISAQAAARAAKKGILIINCMGNEGLSKWQTMVTPADADSILSVGAIEPSTGLAAKFSSVGPTADQRMKPNVCAPGKVVTIDLKGGFRIVEGTSFSAPLVTGFAACTWQLHPSLSAQEVISLIEKSGHLYPYYDYSHGYGIPQATKIINPNEAGSHTAISLEAGDKNFSVQIPKDEFTTPWILPDHYLYYHVSNPSGHLTKYGVYRIKDENPFVISNAGFVKGDIFRCSYNGVTTVWKEDR